MVGICLAWMSSRLSHRIFAFSFFDHFSQTVHRTLPVISRGRPVAVAAYEKFRLPRALQDRPGRNHTLQKYHLFSDSARDAVLIFPMPGPAGWERRILRPAGPDFKRRICLIPCDPVDLSVDGGAYFVKVLL